ncbi:MAG: PLP-dependent aminotransferase family protein [Lachnospiraceae bacterium]|nr:PLP-dependent aminotransferase family protein [Lachnospiraceae bacterium]
MRYTIHKEAAVPAYLQLYRQIRDDITNEIYPCGSKLPSKRLVADETGLSTVTVEHAYSLLCDEGYAQARQRCGYFVAFRPDDGFAVASGREAGRPPAAFSVCHAGTASEFPFSVLTKTMRRVMSEYAEAILDRSPNAGCLPLREAIRQYLARSRGIRAETAQIVIGSGAEYLYGLIVELMGRERVYAIESPSYQKIEQVYRAGEVRCEMLPLGQDGIESRALWASQATVLHITPYRSFPSGVTASASKRHEYLRWAAKNRRYLVEDDYESEFSVSRKPEETLFSYTDDDNVIYMNTFSQTVSPSLRAGYMVLPAHLVSVFEQKLGFYSCTVPTYIQLVLAELIVGGDFERHINRVRRRKRRELRP